MFLTSSCATGEKARSGSDRKLAVAENDPFLWLEEIESESALRWVKARSQESSDHFSANPLYSKVQAELLKIYEAKDKIPDIGLRGKWVTNFWQDEKHVRGIWRRATLEEYSQGNPKWQVLLDLDALGRKEKVSWVYRSSSCLPPAFERCLISLSADGKDVTVVREFDMNRRAFVKHNAFRLPEARNVFSWVDRDTLLIGTDLGEGSLLSNGYPRQVRRWKRGTPLKDSQLVFEAGEKDVYSAPWTQLNSKGAYSFISRYISRFEIERFYLSPGGELQRLPFPIDSDLKNLFEDRLLFQVRSVWKVGEKVFPEGALLAVSLAKLQAPDLENHIEIVFTPSQRSAVSSVSVSSDAAFLEALENVQDRVYRLSRSPDGNWSREAISIPGAGNLWIVEAGSFDSRIILGFEGFLIPSSRYLYEGSTRELKLLRQLAPRFAGNQMEVQQLEATSADGTQVPYFVVHPKGVKLDASNPTLMYGYGGFGKSLSPYYLQGEGKVWLERGGIYVLANIRGGGEFGPAWHKAAMKENRQRSFDDFIAVAEDLIRRKFTSPEHLGIQGGSNGGLLVGAVMVQRPELFNAVVCEVPLLDMVRYHLMEMNGKKMGATWAGEYGTVDDPQTREAIGKYSPYQNIRKDIKLPRPFLMTSTRDDRVHSGHARKFVAKLQSLGHPVWYFENTEGGHGGAADFRQSSRMQALWYSYLFEQLKGGKPAETPLATPEVYGAIE